MTLIHKLAAAGVALVTATALLAAEIDLTGIDTFLMQDMDATVKDLEPLIGAKNAKDATEAGVFLEQGLGWTEEYFTSKGVPDAAKLARAGKERARAVQAALAANDFGAAQAAARDVAKSCRACHDVYRP
jgi:hypothetical protein